jgi:hypothetical protein
MHQPYRNLPRIDDPAPMLARQRWEDLHREAAQARLAQLAGADRVAAPPRVFALARHVWHALWVSIGRKVFGRGVGIPANQVAPASEAS